ncbi:MAG: hypothetical protein ACTHME_05050 [Candidatus Nitrosocosmicus sp.]
MTDLKISSLTTGTPKLTDLYVGVDTTDPTISPTGTDKKYTREDDVNFVISSIILSGDVTGAASSNVISNNVVTNAKLDNMAAHTIKGNNTGSLNDPIDLTISQVKSELSYGTMADQNSNNVNITGGTINGTSLGNSTPVSLVTSSIDMPSFINSGVVHNNASGVFSSSLIVNADISSSAAIADTKLSTISTAGKVSNSATSGSSSNSANTLVLRDNSGNFSANTITATLLGSATTSVSATNFTGSLSGNITGTQSATVISSGVIVNSMISASAAIDDTKLSTISTSGKVANSATTATSSNIANSIVSRDSSGNCSVGQLTLTTGLLLPSSGGTATVLDYNGVETITFQMTGAVTPTFDFPVTFSRIGKNVTMQWNGFQKARNSVDFLFTADLVPSRFLPSYTSGNPLVWDCIIIDGASLSSFSIGSISFGSSGNIQIGRLDGANFTNTYCGILGSSISYIVN